MNLYSQFEEISKKMISSLYNTLLKYHTLLNSNTRIAQRLTLRNEHVNWFFCSELKVLLYVL